MTRGLLIYIWGLPLARARGSIFECLKIKRFGYQYFQMFVNLNIQYLFISLSAYNLVFPDFLRYQEFN